MTRSPENHTAGIRLCVIGGIDSPERISARVGYTNGAAAEPRRSADAAVSSVKMLSDRLKGLPNE